jgi:hypothetical protein
MISGTLAWTPEAEVNFSEEIQLFAERPLSDPAPSNQVRILVPQLNYQK